MKRIDSILTFFCLIGLLMANCARDEEVMTGTINGFVSEYANANNPIAGATVTLSSKGLTKTTGNDGRFEFTGLEPGTYTIAVSAETYQPTTKQVTVYAGQNVICDVQLVLAPVNVEIIPNTLSFGKDVEQLSFSITNKSSRNLAYSISNVPDFISVSPVTGNVASNGNQAVTVSVVNRTSITTSRNGQFTVNIGNNSYNVSVNVEPYQEEKENVDITPNTLSFGKDVEQLSFSITNKSSRSLAYSISNVPDFISVSPITGNVASNSNQAVTVSVVNRTSITTSRNGQFTVNIGNNSYNVSVNVEPYQEEKENVDITPNTLSFGKDVEQLSFSITNKSSRSLAYSISNVPDFISVSPVTGNVASNGNQAVTVSVVNRTSITTSRNGQFTVNIGNNSYNVSVNVEPYQEEKINIDINPQNLTFDSSTEQLSFTMTSNNSFTNKYAISTNLDVLTLSHEEGTLQPRAQNTIAVTVKNRKAIDAARNGQITISVGANTYIISVHIDKYVESGGGNPSQATDVVNGLYAYYTFEDNYIDQTDTELSLVGIGTSFTNSFDGSKALRIPAKKDAYISIPEGLIDQPRMSISFWVKDLDDGHIFHAVNRDYNDTSFLLAMIDGRLRFIVTRYNNIYQFNNCPSFIHNKLDGWHMITLVSDFNQTEYSTVTTRLYIDGKYTDVVTEGDNVFGESEGGAGQHNYRYCTKFILGGEHTIKSNLILNASSITIDNLRIYKYRCLSSDEVKNIYNIERKTEQ